MRLRQIFEAPVKTAAFAIGRLNPATIGHERLVDAIKSQPGDHFLFLTDRAPKLPDDPLGPQEKLEWAKQSFNGIEVRLAKSVAIAANQLYRLGYTEVTFLEGEDKLYNMLMQYSGQTQGKRGPIEFPFKFDKIKYVKLERNADDPGAAGMSATKLRGYAADGNYEMFVKGITSKAQPQAKALYNTLRTAMNISGDEDINELNLFKKADNTSIKAQDPNKLKVLDWVASRADGKEHFLSFYRKGAAWSGKLLFIRPDQAKKFMQKVEQNDDYLPQIKQALTNIATAGKLFDRLGIKYQIRRAE